jgi:hypothetical protein
MAVNMLLTFPSHAKGLPVLRALPLCTCCRHYPGTVTGVLLRSFHPVISAFPERVVRSACATYFSRRARHSLSLRPAHSRCHRMSWPATPEASTASLPPRLLRLLPAGAVAGWGFHPLEKRRLCTAHTLLCRS